MAIDERHMQHPEVDGLLTAVRYDSATVRARALRLSFISLISLSTSSMNLEGGS